MTISVLVYPVNLRDGAYAQVPIAHAYCGEPYWLRPAVCSMAAQRHDPSRSGQTCGSGSTPASFPE
jgi:hypothetical protein